MSAIAKPRRSAQSAASFEEDPANRPIFPVWAWVAAAVLAMVTGYTIRQMTFQTTQLATLRRQMKLAAQQNRALQDQLELGRQVAAVMMSPDSVPLKLLPKDAKTPILRAYLHPHMGVAITADHMPVMPAARTLELWVVPTKGKSQGVAIFRPDVQGQVAIAAAVRIAMNEIAALAVSDEPAGGSTQPTTAPAWIVQLQ